MHAKRAAYPSGRRASVYLQLGRNEDRHGVCTSATRLSPSLCLHLCAEEFKLLEVSKTPPPSRRHTHTLFSLFFPTPPLSISSWQWQAGPPGGSGTPTKATPSLPCKRESTPPSPKKSGRMGINGAECPNQAPVAASMGRRRSSSLRKSAKVTVVYLRSNKRRSLVNTSLPNSARSAFFFFPHPPPPLASCASVYFPLSKRVHNRKMDQFRRFLQRRLWFSGSNIYAACPLGRRKIRASNHKHTLSPTNTARAWEETALLHYLPSVFVSFCEESQGDWDSASYKESKKMWAIHKDRNESSQFSMEFLWSHSC